MAVPNRSPSPRAWALALGAVFAVIVAATLLLLALDPEAAALALTPDDPTLAYSTNQFLHRLARTDSWKPMLLALAQLQNHPDLPLYRELFFYDHIKFQYPLTSLLLPDLLLQVPGFGRYHVVVLLTWGSWLAVWLTALIAFALFATSLRRSVPIAPGPPRAPHVVLAPIVALTVVFYPLVRSFEIGQVQTAITLLVGAALLAWQHRRKALAGLCLGLCCALKPQWAVLFVWGALRREWTMVASGAGVAAVLFLVAGARYGFFQHWDYLSVLSYLARHGESFFPNQSVNGLVNRMLFNGNNLEWVRDAFPDFHPLVYAATLVSALLLIGGALAYRWREPTATTDLALAVLSVTMASPIAWEHHYGLLLPIFALIAPRALAERPLGRFTGAWLLAAYLIASQRLDFVNAWAYTPYNFLESYLLFAALMVLFLLYRLGAGSRMPAWRRSRVVLSGVNAAVT